MIKVFPFFYILNFRALVRNRSSLDTIHFNPLHFTPHRNAKHNRKQIKSQRKQKEEEEYLIDYAILNNKIIYLQSDTKISWNKQ